MVEWPLPNHGVTAKQYILEVILSIVKVLTILQNWFRRYSQTFDNFDRDRLLTAFETVVILMYIFILTQKLEKNVFKYSQWTFLLL